MDRASAVRDRLRLGILGTARIARTLFIPGVRASQLTQVAAVASRDIGRARSLAAELNIPHAHGSYEALLADPDVDAVYICLPNSLHVAWTIAAAKAGKHVLCEKPLASRLADAERMAAACHQAGVILMEAFMWRHHPQRARVGELIESGVIGEPNFVRSSFTYVISELVDQHRNVRLQADLEGGSLMDVGCYGVNMARWAFDAEPLVASGQQALDASAGVDIAFIGALRFPGDRLAAIDSSFARPGSNTYTIEGVGGRLHVERAFRPDDAPGRIIIQRPGHDDAVVEVPPANQFANEADHFAESIRGGRLLPPAEAGVEQARVIEALYASATSTRAIELG
jgi:predicted dehydrogenase